MIRISIQPTLDNKKGWLTQIVYELRKHGFSVLVMGNSMPPVYVESSENEYAVIRELVTAIDPAAIIRVITDPPFIPVTSFSLGRDSNGKIEKTEELKGKIDFGIITIRPDEYDAVLGRFGGEDNVKGNRWYRISNVPIASESTETCRVAIVRCIDQGTGEAQSLARDLISDLEPKCLLVVGIGGAIPDADYTLGDVIVANRIHDFTVEADGQNQKVTYDLSGGPVPRKIEILLASLASFKKELGDWGNDNCIPKLRPPVEWEDSSKYYGSEKWQRKVRKSLEFHFGPRSKLRVPIVLDGAVASSDRLIKDADYTERLLEFIRKTKAVEMEMAGVLRAARSPEGEYLLTTIRGLSDVIGFERDEAWTPYACQSAAAFAYAFVRLGKLKLLNHEQ